MDSSVEHCSTAGPALNSQRNSSPNAMVALLAERTASMLRRIRTVASLVEQLADDSPCQHADRLA
jgi:hypothetical protein